MAGHFVSVTDAKEVALHFYKCQGRRPDARMGRTVNTAKAMLKNGFTKEEIIAATDYLFEKAKVDIYSIGYIATCINDALEQIKRIELEKEAKQQKLNIPKPSVEVSNDSSERNRAKLERANSKSNVGKKYNFDMFEE